MILTKRSAVTLALIIVGLCLVAMPVSAATQVAKVTRFTGQAFMQTGNTAVPINRVGQAIMDGDRIQTQDGEVDLTFTDGAVMKIRPYSSSMIQEREEESGFWLFKTKKLVRRLTAFVGKMYFKSGTSKRENFLQTPTAVCALRGSSADFGSAGTDDMGLLVNLLTGALTDKLGPLKPGPFQNTREWADKNTIYQKMGNVFTQLNRFGASGSNEDRILAMQNVAELFKTVGDVLKNNPDPAVRADADDFSKKAQELFKTVGQQAQADGVVVETTEETTIEATEKLPSTTTSSSTTTTTTTTTTTAETTSTSSSTSSSSTTTSSSTTSSTVVTTYSMF